LLAGEVVLILLRRKGKRALELITELQTFLCNEAIGALGQG
jgi:hypothetical protein